MLIQAVPQQIRSELSRSPRVGARASCRDCLQPASRYRFTVWPVAELARDWLLTPTPPAWAPKHRRTASARPAPPSIRRGAASESAAITPSEPSKALWAAVSPSGTACVTPRTGTPINGLQRIAALDSLLFGRPSSPLGPADSETTPQALPAPGAVSLRSRSLLRHKHAIAPITELRHEGDCMRRHALLGLIGIPPMCQH
jgi:hypothetical protein